MLNNIGDKKVHLALSQKIGVNRGNNQIDVNRGRLAQATLLRVK